MKAVPDAGGPRRRLPPLPQARPLFRAQEARGGGAKANVPKPPPRGPGWPKLPGPKFPVVPVAECQGHFAMYHTFLNLVAANADFTEGRNAWEDMPAAGQKLTLPSRAWTPSAVALAFLGRPP